MAASHSTPGFESAVTPEALSEVVHALAVSHNKLGDMDFLEGHLGQALQHYTEGSAVRRRALQQLQQRTQSPEATAKEGEAQGHMSAANRREVTDRLSEDAAASSMQTLHVADPVASESEAAAAKSMARPPQGSQEASLMCDVAFSLCKVASVQKELREGEAAKESMQSATCLLDAVMHLEDASPQLLAKCEQLRQYADALGAVDASKP